MSITDRIAAVEPLMALADAADELVAAARIPSGHGRMHAMSAARRKVLDGFVELRQAGMEHSARQTLREQGCKAMIRNGRVMVGVNRAAQ